MRILLSLALIGACGIGSAAQQNISSNAKQQATAPAKARTDRSGKPRKGKASYYARRFAGKKMADGTRMNPDSNAAASKTLPLGTKARVTNLDNGKSANVEIRDRGPYEQGRIVDVTPKTAGKLGIRKEGVAPVEVKPVEIPPPDNGKADAAAPGSAH